MCILICFSIFIEPSVDFFTFSENFKLSKDLLMFYTEENIPTSLTSVLLGIGIAFSSFIYVINLTD